MEGMKDWERPSAAVLGYIIPAGEGMQHPFFPTARSLAWTASTGGLIVVEEAVLEPGQSGPSRHYHTNVAELFYVLDGELLLQIGEQVVRAQPGAFAFCPIGCVHAFRALGPKPARVLIMALPPGIPDAAFREWANLPADAGEDAWREAQQKWGVIVVGPPLEGE